MTVYKDLEQIPVIKPVELTTPFFLGVERSDHTIVQLYFGASRPSFFLTQEAARQYRDHVFAQQPEMGKKLGIYEVDQTKAKKVE